MFIATLQEAAERELISESESDWHETACQESAASYDHIPTFAVRGATLARPEGHCLCLDEEYIRHHEAIARTRPPPLSQRHRMPQTIHDVTSRFNSRTVDLLPTVVVNDDQRSGIRFCSADASHVTRLITPFFNCGGVEGPVTMFLVVSSDDESCWVSGRNSRFEVGHRFTSHGEAHTVTLVVAGPMTMTMTTVAGPMTMTMTTILHFNVCVFFNLTILSVLSIFLKRHRVRIASFEVA